MFTELPEPGGDPILRSARVFLDDPALDKIDMGIGVYKDAQGKAPVLSCVKAAEARLLDQQDSKVYLSGSGNELYNEQIRALVFASDPAAGPALLDRAVSIQTPGGTGALRVAADFLRQRAPGVTVWIPAPTWPNHRHIFGTVGFNVAEYPYFDAARGQLEFDAMLDALGGAAPGDVVILHGCCHNPSGADPDHAQWTQIAQLLARRGLMPLVDLAYLGLGDGLAGDAQGLRILAETLDELIVASSCSKNFALYRERVGALSFVGGTRAAAEKAKGHALSAARAIYSMPPDHGAAVVATVLSDPALRAMWDGELAAMRARLAHVRRAFADGLSRASGRDFGYLAAGKGMFTLVPLTPEMVGRLRDGLHIHTSGSGRLNLAGLTDDTVDRVAAAIGAELGAHENA